MENTKRKINIIDLIFIVILVAVVVVGALKISDIKDAVDSTTVAKVEYVVEVPNQDPEIMNYISTTDKVFEDESLKRLGEVVDVSYRPYKIYTEDKVGKKHLLEEVPNKITVDIKIAADADKANGSLSVDSINLLVGKTISLNVGNTFVEGVIIEVNDMSEAKEVQE